MDASNKYTKWLRGEADLWRKLAEEEAKACRWGDRFGDCNKIASTLERAIVLFEDTRKGECPACSGSLHTLADGDTIVLPDGQTQVVRSTTEFALIDRNERALP